MTVNISSLGPLIQEQYRPDFTRAWFANDALFPILGINPKTLKRHPGGAYHNWTVTMAGPSPAVFTEGDPLSASNSTFLRAYVSPVYVGMLMTVTGISLDSAVGAAAIRDAVGSNVEEAMAALIDLMTTSFLGSTYGLELAIDSASNYGGLTRASYTAFQSTETAAGSVVPSYDLFSNMITGMRDNDKGSKISKQTGAIIIPGNLTKEVYDICGSKGIHILPSNDAADGLSDMKFDGISVYPVPDVTDTVALFLDLSPGNIEAFKWRDYTVEFHSRSGDDQVFEISAGMSLAIKNPKNHGKLTGLSG